MGRCFIISVGTSLISNFNKREGVKNKYEAVIDCELWRNATQPFPGHILALKNPFYCESYGKDYGRLIDYISSLNSRDEIAKTGAEMSSLLFRRGKSGEQLNIECCDRLIFIKTNTPEGDFCAYGLKWLVQDRWGIIGSGCWNDEIVKIEGEVDGLGDAEDKNRSFSERGLPNFLQKVHNLIISNKGSYEVILLPTGGYKALIPYMVIAGLLEGRPNLYIYEESSNVLDLPPLPLHVDIPAWLQVQTVLDILEGKTPHADNKVFEFFKDRISGIMVPDSHGKMTRTGLDEIFRKKAKEIGDKPELVIRAKNSPLLKFLDNGTLEQRFLKLAEIGHLIWKGDRVPEMADHALRHHNDLFLLAEKFLLPILYFRPDFLTPEELFTLLCALFLHDCGHVVGAVTVNGKGQTKRLLPTEVRDHHHVLGYLRLMEPDKHGGTGKILYLSLKEDGESDEVFRKNFLEAPATIGLYHRKKMNITEDKDSPVFNDLSFPSLERKLQSTPIEISGSTIKFDRATLLVALLRIIDSLDEQASRTGSPDDVAFHLALLDTEESEEMMRAGAIKEALGSIGPVKCTLGAIDQALNKRIQHYIEKEGKGYQDEEVARISKGSKLDPEQFQKVVDQVLSKASINPMTPLFIEYIHARLKAFFKKFQKVPYSEKVFIQECKIKGDRKENGQIEISINLEMVCDEALIKAYKKAECQTIIKKEKNGRQYEFAMENAEGRDAFRKFMLGELQEEYSVENGIIQKIFEKENKITINYNLEK